MKYYIRSLTCIILTLFIAVGVVGCGKQSVVSKKYSSDAEYYYFGREIVAQNDKLKLSWNDETGELSLTDKVSGALWTTASVKEENIDTDQFTNPQLKAPITVTYLSADSSNEETVNAYSHCMKDENFSAVEIKNGIEVTYYFESAEISIPVKYTLKGECLSISVNPKDICENDNKVISVAVMPFMCSVRNELTAGDNYLFVPSGSGALIYPKSIDDGVVSIISQQVYGIDRMNGVVEKNSGEEIKLPVFGAKIGNNAMCAIIEKGAANAEIITNVGSTTYGYSSVYASFNMRGGYYCESTYMNWYTSKKNLYSDSMIQTEVSISFYPLSDNVADYVGMAKLYREYLESSKDLKSDNNENLLNLKMIGGFYTTEYTLGIPHSRLLVTTTYNNVKAIAEELSSETNTKLNVNLMGFTPTGNTVDEIGGGFKNCSSYGKIGILSKLQNNENINLFFNFDLLRFSASGGGVKKGADYAVTSVGEKLFINETDIATSESNLSYGKYMYVKRDLLGTLAFNAVNTVKDWGIKGISINTLSNQSYSDYSNQKYFAKSGMDTQVTGIINAIKKNGIDVATVSANAYAANGSAHIYDTPISSKGYQIYDLDVPFYQIVYKGIKSMSVPSLNFGANSKQLLLKAAESGIGIAYTVIGEYDRDLINSAYNDFYSADYSDLKDDIISDIQQYSELFNKVKGSKIISHTVISENVRKTTFENGIEIYVNYGESDYKVDGITVQAENYIVVGEEV